MPAGSYEWFREEQYREGQYNEDWKERLQPKGPFHGVGELLFYWPGFDRVSYTDPEMHIAMRVVNEMGGVAMIHPRDDERPEDPAQLEEIIKTYPNVTFLFHGGSHRKPLILPLMDKYPNVYFTYDVIYMIIGAGHKCGVRRMLNTRDTNYPRAVQQLLENVERCGIDDIIEQALEGSALWFQRHPDRIVWGTDLHRWMWKESASDKFIEIGRHFIARLPAEVQEDYAYKNALRVFGKYLIPKQ
jgi:predicted TIM-barrel fold metal-dependent hydrolase